jgi:elongation factor P
LAATYSPKYKSDRYSNLGLKKARIRYKIPFMPAKASNITKGMVILFKGQPHQVLDKSFFNLGRGMGHLRAKLKNIKTGNTIRYTFKSEEPFEEVNIDTRKLQYLYKDETSVYFMDPKTFEQVVLELKVVDELVNYLKEGDEYYILFYEDKPIGIRPPQKVKLKVVYAEDAVKGDTVSGAQKIVKLETGYEIKVPLFIKQGDELIINTETDQYVSRG